MAKFTGHTITSDSALGSAVIERSLRFNNADNAYLQRSVGSTSNRRTYTYSFWTKRALTARAERQFIYNGQSSSAPYMEARFNYDGTDGYDTFQFFSYSSQYDMRLAPRRSFRDDAWYHFVIAVDTTQATESNRIKMYINGVQETDFYTPGGASAEIYPSQNFDTAANVSGNIQVVGKHGYASGQSYDGYLTEFHHVDGYQYDPSYFGFTDPQTGIWMPKRYEGTHGTNGYYLDFSDNSSTAALGIDKSTNGNDFTVSNLATGDSTLDSPSNNFATLKFYSTPESSGCFLTEGNLKFVTGSSGSARNLDRMGISTLLPTSGKWYAEVRVLDSNGQNFIGVAPYQVELLPDVNNTRYAFVYGSDGDKYVRTAGSESIATYAASYTQNDVIGVYVDMDASTPLVSFSKNGQWANGSGSWNQSTPTSYITLGDTFFTESTGGHSGIGFLVSSGSGGTSATYQFNFGQDSTFSGATTAGGNTDDRGIGDFKYPVPSGALALCSVNFPLTAPSVIRPQKHFDTVLFTGNGSTGQSITSLEFQPDLIWLKNRSGTNNHAMVNSVVGRAKGLYPDSNSAEFNSSTGRDVASFDISGFTVGEPEQASSTNNNGSNIVAWCWKAGGAAVANTDGSINTQVSANQEAGFSIVTWTGSGADASIGHGLGKKPKVLFVKNRSAGDNWKVWFKGVTTDDSYSFQLDTSGANYSGSDKWYNSPNGNDTTTTTFGVSNDGATNRSGELFVSFCWAEIPGYSKFGIYRGNGNAKGKFVDCGFRPAFLIIKRVNEARNWMLFDNKRDPDNPVQTFLEADQTSTDATLNDGVLFLANGFRCVTSDTDVNANDTSGGDTYIFMAYAEQPGTTSFDTFPNGR